MTGNAWDCVFQPDCGYKIQLEKGVYSVYKNEEDKAANKPINYEVEFFLDHQHLHHHLYFSVCRS